MNVAIISAVVAVGTTAYGLAESSNQKRRARHQQEALERSKPVDKIPDELVKNQELASLRSKTGLPSEQYAMAQKAIQRQQARTLKSASDRRMGLGLLAGIDDNANRAQGNLDVANAQARIGNEKTLMNVNNQVASWKTAKINRDLSRWDNNMDYARAVEGSANQNRVNTIMSGINAAGLIAGSAYNNSDWANGLFGGRQYKIPTLSNKVDSSGMATPQRKTGVGNNFILDANGNRVYL